MAITLSYKFIDGKGNDIECIELIVVYISIWSFFIITGYTLILAMVILTLLQYLNNKRNPLSILLYPLYYIPFFIAVFSMLFYRFIYYIEEKQMERKLHNPAELAKIACQNLKAQLPTGYPQSYLFPKYIVIK